MVIKYPVIIKVKMIEITVTDTKTFSKAIDTLSQFVQIAYFKINENNITIFAIDESMISASLVVFKCVEIKGFENVTGFSVHLKPLVSIFKCVNSPMFTILLNDNDDTITLKFDEDVYIVSLAYADPFDDIEFEKDEFFFELKINSADFKKHIGNILGDVIKFNFNKSVITMESKIDLIQQKISINNHSEYKCDKPIEMYFSIGPIYKILKNLLSETLEIARRSSKDAMIFTYKNDSMVYEFFLADREVTDE